ncbi:endo-beta-N-acetylglucosaminidase [Corynebacterium diphtheriae]|uniref:EndoS/ChiA family endoglycosidase n=1 Tax=Corynebacterium diphtheriae TaxID=1717 RepID=UPI00024694E6|nr:endo-beta-N-acetylglucosaminidase [Corynebacterium diphtheriae]AEX70794.1 endo-beta-N-acetylglucosaminidase F2 [Corynebacterium diphtheriae PW8]UEB38367.1 endo-beta-N-acetylglucosaminidase [Corynebacterium diphtheriae]WLF42412.1 endo-beta-N-acetylglucosaminidase [Corynebacterium diphtheriae]
MVSLFHAGNDHYQSDAEFWKTFDEVYHPELQRRGTRVVRTISATELLKETVSLRAVGAKADAGGYRQVAEKIKKEYVDAHNLDGLDVDMEVLHLERNWYSSRADVWRIRKIMAALSELLGPKADVNQGKKKDDSAYKFLIYDTFDDVERSQIRAVAELVDYVLPQTYKSGGAEIDQLWNASRNTLSSCQFVPRYAHPEEGDTVNRFETAIGDVDSSKAMEVAAGQPAGGEKGGAFVYAIDRDGRTYGEDNLNNVKETDFSFTKRGVALARPVAFSKAQDEAKRVISGKYPSVSATFTEQVDKARTFGEIEELLDKAHQDFVKLKPKSNPHINENQDTKGNDGEPNEQDPISDEKQKQPSGNRSVFCYRDVCHRSSGSCFLRDGLVALCAKYYTSYGA